MKLCFHKFGGPYIALLCTIDTLSYSQKIKMSEAF